MLACRSLSFNLPCLFGSPSHARNSGRKGNNQAMGDEDLTHVWDAVVSRMRGVRVHRASLHVSLTAMASRLRSRKGIISYRQCRVCFLAPISHASGIDAQLRKSVLRYHTTLRLVRETASLYYIPRAQRRGSVGDLSLEWRAYTTCGSSVVYDILKFAETSKLTAWRETWCSEPRDVLLGNACSQTIKTLPPCGTSHRPCC